MTLCCPRCCGVTERCGDQISCEKCGVVGEWRGNLPCFTDPNYYWGEIPLDEMRRANEIAEQTSWEEAVDRVVNDRVLRDYIRNSERAAFQYLWNLTPESEILDIGAGWGAIAAGLAENFARVVAVEGVWERSRFLRTRMTQMGHDNVEVICANLLELPLQAGQFDAVVLNGVLEWVGLASREGNPRDLQVAFLQRVHGLLKPGGIVCVGIENRIGWMLWRGARDHSGLRFTSLMPRKVADLWCRYHAQGIAPMSIRTTGLTPTRFPATGSFSTRRVFRGFRHITPGTGTTAQTCFSPSTARARP